MSTYNSQHDQHEPANDGSPEMRGGGIESSSRDQRTAAATLESSASQSASPNYGRQQSRPRFEKRSRFDAYNKEFHTHYAYNQRDAVHDSQGAGQGRNHEKWNDEKWNDRATSETKCNVEGAEKRASYSIGILSAVMLVSLSAFIFSNSPQAFVICTGLCSILLIIFNAALENLIQKIAARLQGTVSVTYRATQQSGLLNAQNLAMLFAGVLFPVVVLTFGATTSGSQLWTMFTRHPIGFLIYSALIFGCPAANALVLSCLLSEKVRHPRQLAASCGIAAGASFCIGLIGSFMFREWDLVRSFFVGAASFASFTTACILYRRLMKRSSVANDRSCKITAGVSMLLSMVAIGAFESRPATIRIAESFALSSNAESRRMGISVLNSIGAAPDILEEINYQTPPKSNYTRQYYPSSGTFGDAYANGYTYAAEQPPIIYINRYDPVLFKPSLSLAFFKIYDDESESIYYRMTGSTPRDNVGITTQSISSASVDQQFGWLGGVIDNLTLSRSTLTGNINSETLSSYMDWTFELSNATGAQHEAKMRLGLPKGAVVSRVTAWIGGQPHEAQFSTVSNTQQAYSWVVRGRRDPVLVKSIDKDYVEVNCFPIPVMGTMQVRIGITAPVKPETARLAKMELPYIHSTNFDQTTCKTQLNLKSDYHSIAYAEQLGTAEKFNSKSGILQCETSLDNTTSIFVKHDATEAPIIAEDTRSGRKSLTITRMLPVIKKRPAKIVVLLDGSASLEKYRKEIATGLSALPTDEILTTFMLASDEDTQALAASDKPIQEKVLSAPLVGGQLNERFLKQAVIDAGDNGCVLWIHGTQAPTDPAVAIGSINDDPLTHNTRIYHLQVGAGYNTVANGLTYQTKQHLQSITRSGVPAVDLADFCNRELLRKVEYKIVRDHADSVPSDSKVIPSGVASTQLATLWAHDEIERLDARGNWSGAEAVGMLYRVVSVATSAVVLERASDYTQFNMQEADSKNYSKNAGFADAKQRAELVNQVRQNTTSQMSAFNSDKNSGSQTQQYSAGQAPMLQGATNGTVGPQGQDATVIMGVNSAATVRVNQMANIESILNIIANALEILGLCWGVPNIILGVMRFGMVRDAAVRIGVGIGSVTFGLATPGLVSWICGIVRDSNCLG